ncbi:hypothetical protein HDU89_004258 [Geranomyces variabilis]|nr:hypothetical protein HDU89_004258 [Geranomyces variabilis]
MDAEEDWDSWLAAKLEKDLAIADEAFAEYITQLCSEDTMEDDERREVIVEFLDEASAGQPVTPCVDEILAKHAERQAAAAAREKEDRAKLLHEAKQKELQALQADTAVDPHSAVAGGKKKTMSLEEKLARDRLLALYGYESEDQEGDDAERKSGGDGGAGAAGVGGGDSSGLLMKNDNAERVRAEEQAKKAKAQAEHQKNVQRNKENVEKQKAEREKEKKRTVKKEKRRM